ncbi:MAG: DoxX family membrane protein [Planctomycetia bacterium]
MRLIQTTAAWWPLVPRLVAGLPLLFISLKHFGDPAHFREILVAAGAPLPDLNVYAASTAEAVAGALLLAGLLTRFGGLLGVATMLPAIGTTILFMSRAEHPWVPPLPLPAAVLVGSAIALWVGGGSLSIDAKLAPRSPNPV